MNFAKQCLDWRSPKAPCEIRSSAAPRRPLFTTTAKTIERLFWRQFAGRAATGSEDQKSQVENWFPQQLAGLVHWKRGRARATPTHFRRLSHGAHFKQRRQRSRVCARASACGTPEFARPHRASVSGHQLALVASWRVARPAKCESFMSILYRAPWQLAARDSLESSLLRRKKEAEAEEKEKEKESPCEGALSATLLLANWIQSERIASNECQETIKL